MRGVRWIDNRKGQSIVEYLVIAAIIVGAIIAIQPTIKTNINNLFQKGADKTNIAQTALGNLTTEQ